MSFENGLCDFCGSSLTQNEVWFIIFVENERFETNYLERTKNKNIAKQHIISNNIVDMFTDESYIQNINLSHIDRLI